MCLGADQSGRKKVNRQSFGLPYTQQIETCSCLRKAKLIFLQRFVGKHLSGHTFLVVAGCGDYSILFFPFQHVYVCVHKCDSELKGLQSHKEKRRQTEVRAPVEQNSDCLLAFRLPPTHHVSTCSIWRPLLSDSVPLAPCYVVFVSSPK